MLQKNIPLFVPVTERLTGTLQSNGVDYWVVSQYFGTNGYVAFSVTSAGVNTTPVISYSGPVLEDGGANLEALGYMKISPDGSKLCYANFYGDSTSQLFDFNNTTGIVSNNVSLVDSMGYGVEFSPDNSKVYIARTGQPYVITQYDLSAGSPAAIQSSATQIVYEYYNQDTTMEELGGALELGPDNRIYANRLQQKILSVINNPNLKGAACSFSDTAVVLSNHCLDGLPNNIKSLSSDCSLPVTLLSFTSTLLNKNSTTPMANHHRNKQQLFLNRTQRKRHNLHHHWQTIRRRQQQRHKNVFFYR